jgi:hypothetical protein
MNTILSIHWYLVAAIWYSVNGLLHDIFIIRAHKGPYNRDLLRLLMDGHVLILSGLILIPCWYLVKQGIVEGSMIALIVAAGMIVYCAMIFPFLKSMVTLVISILLAAVSLYWWWSSAGRPV